MYKHIALFFALALLQLASSKSIDIEAPYLVSGIVGHDVDSIKTEALEVVKEHVAPISAESIFVTQDKESTIQMNKPLPVEIAESGLALPSGPIASEVVEFAVPSVDMTAPLIDLPKGPREVVDVPHANIKLQGNAIHNQDMFIHLPRPIVEAPKPIIRTKDVLFRLPQPIFYVPNPIVQHKPMVYHMGHTVRALTPIVNARSYVFKVPQAQIAGKSAYQQPIPAHFNIHKDMV